MTTKSLVAMVFAVLLAFCAGAPVTSNPPEPGRKHVNFVAITFRQNKPEVVFKGRISAEHFRGWFKSNYTVSGERIEVPGNAVSFGTLILTDGDEVIVMPFWEWRNEKKVFFQCQGHTIGEAPMFRVMEDSEKAFLQSMKKKLQGLD